MWTHHWKMKRNQLTILSIWVLILKQMSPFLILTKLCSIARTWAPFNIIIKLNRILFASIERFNKTKESKMMKKMRSQYKKQMNCSRKILTKFVNLNSNLITRLKSKVVSKEKFNFRYVVITVQMSATLNRTDSFGRAES